MNDRSESDRRRDALVTLAYTLAPELRARPLYVVASAELNLVPTARGLNGAVGLLTDLACRDVIGDRWRGRGWCVVLAHLGDIEGTFLHELAHILDGTMPWYEPWCDLPEEILADCAARVRASLEQHLEVSQIPAVDTFHGLHFHRALAHLWHRAGDQGLIVMGRLLGPLCPCPMYQVVRALGDEIHTCRNKHFSEFMARPMPRRFRKLWTRQHGSLAQQRSVA